MRKRAAAWFFCVLAWTNGLTFPTTTTTSTKTTLYHHLDVKPTSGAATIRHKRWTCKSVGRTVRANASHHTRVSIVRIVRIVQSTLYSYSAVLYATSTVFLSVRLFVCLLVVCNCCLLAYYTHTHKHRPIHHCAYIVSVAPPICAKTTTARVVFPSGAATTLLQTLITIIKFELYDLCSVNMCVCCIRLPAVCRTMSTATTTWHSSNHIYFF